MSFRAVLFDWRGTLVTTQSESEWVADGFLRTGRDEDADRLLERIRAANGPNDRLDTPGMDADQVLHKRVFYEVLADAGVDDDLAFALYESESDFQRNAWAVDAASTIRALKSNGLLVGVVSDIHFDIRPAFAAENLDREVDMFALSYEVGAQKPSAEIYDYALNALGLEASDVLMVGDRAHPDGGAIEHGISVLLLPPLQLPEHRRLDRVLDLALPGSL